MTEATWVDRLEKRVTGDLSLNWKEFSRRADVRYSTLMSAMKRRSNPEGDTLRRIAVAAEVTVDWLLTGKESLSSAPNLDREALLEVVKVIRDADRQRTTPISDEVFAEKLADAYERNLQAKRDIQEIAENE